MTALNPDTAAGETEAEGGLDSDGASDLFDEGFDYEAALQQMERRAPGNADAGGAASQPYQVLASRRRASLGARAPVRQKPISL